MFNWLRKRKPANKDLDLIEDLLMHIKVGSTWQEVENASGWTQRAMDRLREAWRTGEKKAFTLSLHEYFLENDNV